MKFKANKIDLKKLLNGDTEIVLTCEDTKNSLISEFNSCDKIEIIIISLSSA